VLPENGVKQIVDDDFDEENELVFHPTMGVAIQKLFVDVVALFRTVGGDEHPIGVVTMAKKYHFGFFKLIKLTKRTN
jgi:hypothetical protein